MHINPTSSGRALLVRKTVSVEKEVLQMQNNRVKWTQAAVTGISVVLALVFLAAGAAKLLNLPTAAEMFVAFGLPRWSLLPVGLIEVFTGALLLIGSTRFFGALAFCAIMIGAAAVHLTSGVMLPLTFANAALFAAAAWVVSKTGMQWRGFGRPAGPAAGAR